MQLWCTNKSRRKPLCLYAETPLRSVGCTNNQNNRAGKSKRKEKYSEVWESTSDSMNRGGNEGRFLITDARRIKMRDAKMWRRESARQALEGNSRSRCPCSLCLFGRPLVRATQAKHLQDYGRHPQRRLQPQVQYILLRHAVCLFAVGFPCLMVAIVLVYACSKLATRSSTE